MCPHFVQALRGGRVYECSHLGLLQWSLGALPVDHAEGDAFGFGGERPADRRPGPAHGDGDGAVAAGLYEELSGAVPKR